MKKLIVLLSVAVTLTLLGLPLTQLEVPPGTTDGQVMTYFGPAKVWYPKTPNGGTTSIPTGTQFVITGTTNQVVFGATNSAPVSTNLILWISVQITGDTNSYRLGLAL